MRPTAACLRLTIHHPVRPLGNLPSSSRPHRRSSQWPTTSPVAPASCLRSQRRKASTAVFNSKSPYFLSNKVFDQSACLASILSSPGRKASTASSTTSPSAATASPINAQLPPHRRRQALKAAAPTEATSAERPLPPDASSLLTTTAAATPSTSLRRILATCLALSKPRLTILVVLSAMAPYALYPSPDLLSPALTQTPSLSPLTLTFLTTGTALCSASANALNMTYEPKTDAMMSRTRNRPLVRGLIGRGGAVLFATAAGLVGVAALFFGVNPTVAGLGLANIVLYAGVYTPFKAISAINTWIGAVVGGIPPLMGWAAAAGETATKDGSWRELLLASDGSSIGGWLMAGLLFAWQFPHFMALSWPIREEYKQAGLRMLAWTNPSRNARVALRYSLVFVPLSLALCAAGVTEWSFAALSLPLNLWIARDAVRFYRYEGHKGSARGLFWASVWHLPGFMILALLCKKDMWSRAWRGMFGEPSLEEGGWEAEELAEMRDMTDARIKEKMQAPNSIK